MKKRILLTAVMATSGLCLAQEVGRVLSSTPVMQQVGVPRQVCTTEPMQVTQPRSGAGALVGAIAGGALANAATHGSGQAAATALGIFGGAVIGDRIEGPATSQVQNVQRCSTQTFYENRTVGYNVVYEYAGRQYAVQMPQAPGPTLQLQVTPVGSVEVAGMVPANNYPPPVQQTYVQPAEVIVTQQPYPVYYPQPYYQQPYYPPVSLQLGFGYWGGHHHGHRYGR